MKGCGPSSRQGTGFQHTQQAGLLAPLAEGQARVLEEQALEATGGTVPAAMNLPQAGAFHAHIRELQDMAKSADVQPN